MLNCAIFFIHTLIMQIFYICSVQNKMIYDKSVSKKLTIVYNVLDVLLLVIAF
jgi:hypothetical protein